MRLDLPRTLLLKLFGKSVEWRLGRTFSPTFDGNNGLSGPSRRLMKVPLCAYPEFPNSFGRGVLGSSLLQAAQDQRHLGPDRDLMVADQDHYRAHLADRKSTRLNSSHANISYA